MSCILCNSAFHFTQYCHIYKSDESRIEQLIEKNWCPKCFSHVGQLHAKRWEERCRSKIVKKCYICFSREHHTVFCPDRSTAPHMLVPAIDKELHKRFFKLFNGKIEQYYLAFLSQEMFDYMNSWECRHPNLKNYPRTTSCEIKLYESLKNMEDAKEISSMEFETLCIVTTEVNLKNLNKSSYYFFRCTLVKCKDIFFQVKKVVLHDSEICESSFLRLLSNFTKIVECRNLKLDKSVKFGDVIKHVPNIVEFVLEDSDIFPDEFWADDLFRYKNTNNFSKLQTEIHSYKFNVESLVKFIKAKSVKDVHLELNLIKSAEDKDDHGHEKALLDKLSEYFETDKEEPKRFLSFNIVEKDANGEKTCRCLKSYTNLIEN